MANMPVPEGPMGQSEVRDLLGKISKHCQSDFDQVYRNCKMLGDPSMFNFVVQKGESNECKESMRSFARCAASFGQEIDAMNAHCSEEARRRTSEIIGSTGASDYSRVVIKFNRVTQDEFSEYGDTMNYLMRLLFDPKTTEPVEQASAATTGASFDTFKSNVKSVFSSISKTFS
eukprot:gnl/Spiro4/899_TR474_c0_g1_i1.p1 gnl/Spiro4/899_TR474_c0_g1~~gnl/Spiro4/899_TR474_c0_g1_i1.p1  ORF type:complete len:192 (+),score=40.64 gnl/Spiro4/899_TR474_c0_g1_i1:56-577(+)